MFTRNRRFSLAQKSSVTNRIYLYFYSFFSPNMCLFPTASHWYAFQMEIDQKSPSPRGLNGRRWANSVPDTSFRQACRISPRLTPATYFSHFPDLAASNASRALHTSRPAMQVFASKPLNAKESSVRIIPGWISPFISLFALMFTNSLTNSLFLFSLSPFLLWTSPQNHVGPSLFHTCVPTSRALSPPSTPSLITPTMPLSSVPVVPVFAPLSVSLKLVSTLLVSPSFSPPVPIPSLPRYVDRAFYFLLSMLFLASVSSSTA